MLDIQLLKDINDKAIIIARKYKIKSPIKSPCNLVSELGGIIVEESLEEENRGYVKKENDKNYAFSIHIPRRLNKEIKTFYIMTNIGYLFLSLGYEDKNMWSGADVLDIEHNYNAFLTYMAEEFALALLIPENKLNKYIKDCSFMGIVNNKKLAERFGVTTDMMIRRRKTLMLIKGEE